MYERTVMMGVCACVYVRRDQSMRQGGRETETGNLSQLFYVNHNTKHNPLPTQDFF